MTPPDPDEPKRNIAGPLSISITLACAGSTATA